MSNTLLKEMIQISKTKQQYLTNLLNITQKQKKVIDQNNIDELQKFINKNQDNIDKINKLDNLFMKKYTELKDKNNINKLEDIDVDKYPQMKILKNVIGEITVLLKKISSLEKENQAEMSKNFNEMKTKLKNVRQGKKAVKGYSNYNNQGGSMFIDNKK